MNLDEIFIAGAKLMKKYTNFMISSEYDFNKIKDKNKLIVVFWHPKCKPCQKIMFKILFTYIKLVVYDIS